MTLYQPGRSRSRGASRRRERRIAIVAACLAALCTAALVPPSTAEPLDLGALPRATLRAPVAPLGVIRLFERPATPWAEGHRGIDLAAAIGDAIVSPSVGVVTFAGRVVDRGVVTVDVGGGILSSVEPVSPTVAVGDHVWPGETLGTVSAEPGHCAPRTCVHWGVRLDGVYFNPLDVLAGFGRIVLLP